MKNRIRNLLVELIAVVFGRVDGATHIAVRIKGRWVVMDVDPSRAGPVSLKLKDWTAAYQLRCYELGMIDSLCEANGVTCANKTAPSGWTRTN